jgi:uncharacterized protein
VRDHDTPAPPAPFLRAEWRDLLMVNFAIAPELLRKSVPAGTELDRWNGQTFVSVVGFHFSRARLNGIRAPFLGAFAEVNLRFYVRRREGDDWRRGVVFVKEIVPRRLVALVARRVYGENFVRLPTRSNTECQDVEAMSGVVRYEWYHCRRWNSASARIRGALAPPVPGSQEQYIVEHYWAYSARHDGSTAEYRVEHPPWSVRACNDARLDCDVKELYGPEFVDALAAPPTSAFVADGSPVIVRRGTQLPGEPAA